MKPSLILAACLATGMVACKEKPAPQAGSPKPTKEVPIEPAFAVPDTFRAALAEVFDGYSRMQSALAEDDLTKAKEAFSSMHATLHMMPKEGLDSAAKAEWDSTDTRIMAILHPMASADSLDIARGHFLEFSAVLAETIGKFGLDGDRTIYHFHCPMARGHKGADWLQEDSVPANPFHGSSMLRCGDLVRILKG